MHKNPLLLLVWLFLLRIVPNVAANSCHINGYKNCTMQLINFGNDSNTFKSKLIWHTYPTNVGISYYYRTSETDDLTVRGIIRWKLPLGNLTMNSGIIYGFNVEVINHDTNERAAKINVLLTSPIKDYLKEKKVMESQLEIDDILKSGKSYNARVHLLPIGEQVIVSSMLSLLPFSNTGNCSEMKQIASKWAAHMNITINDFTGNVYLQFKPAPDMLCIENYEVTVRHLSGFILRRLHVTKSNAMNIVFSGLPRNESFNIEVQANESTDKKCACENCHCLLNSSKMMQIPNIHEQIRQNEPKINDRESAKKDVSDIFLILFILVCFIISVALILYFIIKRYHPALKRRLNLNNRTNFFFGESTTKPEKLLLICPNAVDEEEKLLQMICQAFKESEHSVVCNLFEEHALIAEQNYIQWIYKETSNAEKIIVFHSSSPNNYQGITEVFLSGFPLSDNRIIHVRLSPNVQLKTFIQVDYLLPRDFEFLENAFNIKMIDRFSQISESTSSIDVSSNRHPSVKKSITSDSGLSSMSTHSQNLENKVEIPLNDMHIEMRPLLN